MAGKEERERVLQVLNISNHRSHKGLCREDQLESARTPALQNVIYVALFRGVNVGGHLAQMARLKAMFEALGHTVVRTYIQSGNVVFKPAKGSPDDIRKKIEKEFLKEFGFASPVILRTPEEMLHAIKANPFLIEEGIDL